MASPGSLPSPSLQCTKARILAGLFWLLLCLNVAVAIITITFFLPKYGSFGFSDEVSYLVNSRNWANFLPVITASGLVSVGIYVFVSACLPSEKSPEIS